jgi:hypothetical protein
MTTRAFCLSSVLCLFLYDCGGSSRFAPVKADPTKGTVTGAVTCTDTGKPARFANVLLVPDPNAPKRDREPQMQVGETDLDGRFKIEAVMPGTYYALATLPGYLDPEYGVDFGRVPKDAKEHEDDAEIVRQWKEHMVELTVSAHEASDIGIGIERGAEITGTVTYDDGAPAIGVRFAPYRRNEKGGWSNVGEAGTSSFALPVTSDSRGHFALQNLPAGEYVICAVVPGDSQESSPQICMGNVFRKRDARSVEVSAGETVGGADIVIPLKAIHPVGGTLREAVGEQAPIKATLRLLYADDRETAMTVSAFADGSFLFPFVPEGTYVLQVTEASYNEEIVAGQGDAKAKTKVHEFAPREISVLVDKDVSDLAVALVELPPKKVAQQ